MTTRQTFKIGEDSWVIAGSKYRGLTIELLTARELDELEISRGSITLVCIDGSECMAMNANNDTRAGYVAYGFVQADSIFKSR